MVRENFSRFKNARIFIYISCGLLGLEIIKSIVQLFSIEALLQDKLGNLSGAGANNGIMGLLSLVSTILWIVNAVMFIQWFRRAYFNTHQLGTIRPKYSEGMAAGCWWIPIGNWFIPYQIVKDIAKGYNAHQEKRGSSNLIDTRKVGIWWFLYIGATVVALILVFATFWMVMGSVFNNMSSMRSYGGQPDMSFLADEMVGFLKMVVVISFVTNGLQIVAGLVLAKVMTNIAEVEEEVFENWQGDGGFQIEGSGVSSNNNPTDKPDFPVSGGDVV